MYKLTLIFIFVSLTNAKLNNNPEKLDDKRTVKDKSLWVLDIKDESFDIERLCLANGEEEKVFKKIISPAIENYKLQNLSNANKDDSKKKSEEVSTWDGSDTNRRYKDVFSNHIKNEILLTINKLFMMHLIDTDSYLQEDGIPNDEKKTLKLYFTGPFTSFIVKSGHMNYNYFIVPPSPLPKWFFQQHDNILDSGNIKFVEIPIDVQYDFLEKFLNLLQNNVGYFI